jgi:hypothetical protein
MVPENINNKTTVFATLTLILLPLSATSLMAIGTPNYASAQGLFEGLEREQSGEGVPGGQQADTGGGAVPLNDTTTAQRGDVQGGGGGNATNTTMTGAAGNATNTTMTGAAGNATTTGDGGTTAVGNQTGGGQ